MKIEKIAPCSIAIIKGRQGLARDLDKVEWTTRSDCSTKARGVSSACEGRLRALVKAQAQAEVRSQYAETVI